MAHAEPNPQVELANKPCPETGIRITVFADGRIELNGRQLDVSHVPSTLERLVPAATEFCIHRQHPEAAEPHPNMLKVLDAVTKYQRPVAFYWDAFAPFGPPLMSSVRSPNVSLLGSELD
jgi:hypothetical protein